MEAHPRLSIGIPVYNGEKLLDPRHRPCASARATSHPSVRMLRVRLREAGRRGDRLGVALMGQVTDRGCPEESVVRPCPCHHPSWRCQ
jgi:hypothetical protein